jgi:hypothetical protein
VSSATSSRERAFDADQHPGLTVNELPNTAPQTPVSNISSPGCPLIYAPYDVDSDALVNLNHMELLIHVTQDSDMFNLGAAVENYYTSGLALGLKEAAKAPYLMHELLAFSAQHLAFLHPERSTHYLHQAMSLQTRAISLFNSTWTEVNESNCVGILLFSSVLGHHLLAETLGKRDPGGLDAFIAHYVQCIEMHRGIYTIAKSAWPLLMESELEPILSMSVGFTSRKPIGSDCQLVQELVDSSVDLSEAEKDATRVAIQYLQVGFDAAAAEEELYHHRHQMIYSWTMLVPPEVTGMLVRKQPEALILLAYYAVLLHSGKRLWQAGNAGAYVFDLITTHLGPEWDPWMQYPQNKIIGTSV